MTLVSEIFDRHQHIRFRKISRCAAARDAVRNNSEAMRDALFTLKVANKIDNLSVMKTVNPNIVWIHKHDSPPVVNSAIAIVEAVNRRIELIVTAHRHH